MTSVFTDPLVTLRFTGHKTILSIYSVLQTVLAQPPDCTVGLPCSPGLINVQLATGGGVSLMSGGGGVSRGRGGVTE